jgi:hypothetical protein
MAKIMNYENTKNGSYIFSSYSYIIIQYFHPFMLFPFKLKLGSFLSFFSEHHYSQ